MIRDYIKITEQDLKLAEDFFENDKHFNEWLVNVVRYYRGNKVEIKTKIVQKYFNNYKKTMDYILNSIGTGKKGAEVKAEKQAVKEDTLEGVVEASLEQSLEPNIKTVIEKKEVKDIIDFLNEQAKSKFSPSAKGNIKYIEARLKEGRTTDEFKIVIKDRCKRWMGNAAMSEYLRPETLFGNKFDGYYNEALRAGAKIENTEEKDGIENNALILALEPHVRSQMSWRDKIDYINSKQP